MNFSALDPYLPTPLVSLKRIVVGKGKDTDKDNLINAVLAASGCFLAMRYERKLGLNLAQIAAIATVINPCVTKLAIGGCLTWKGTHDAFTRYQASDLTNFAKASVVALFGYFTNTEKYYSYEGEAVCVGLGGYVVMFEGKQISNVAQIGMAGTLLCSYVAKRAISIYLLAMAGTMILEARAPRNVDSALKGVAILATVVFANTETYRNLWNKYIYFGRERV